MKRPTRVAVAVFLVVILVFGGIGAAIWFGTDGAPAIEVGDQTMSREQVNDELRVVAENQTLAQLVNQDSLSIAPGTIRSQGATGLVTLMVYDLLLKDVLARAGERVTAEDRASVPSGRGPAFTESYDDFPRWFRERFDDRIAVIIAYQRVAGTADEYTRGVRRAARRAGVTVDPAYGRWAPGQIAVVPYPTPFTPAVG